LPLEVGEQLTGLLVGGGAIRVHHRVGQDRVIVRAIRSRRGARLA